MAVLKWGWATVFILILASLILTCKCNSVESSDESERDKEASPAGTQFAEESSKKEVQAEEQQWQQTDFEDNKADSGMNDSPGDSTFFTPPPAKDHFQEELVIRPLHTGDIYATFQFRTQLDTDLVQEGKKGCL